ncbi:MAG: DUF3021 domain-containing protein [Clostridia bacterium]|nr:DUF3021 domain-containing protein [Clostridia bacterium]
MKMNKYVKKFLHRGLMFSGLGCIIAAIIISSEPNLMHDGKSVLTAIVSTYFLAFIHAGTSVFHSVESWSAVKSAFFQLLTLYVSYLVCYLVNSWLSFDMAVVGIFTLVFVIVYAAVWLTVYFSIKATSKKLNKNLK